MGIIDVSTAGGGLVFLFRFFFFFAAFTVLTAALTVVADCFATAALVLR
jgi:hypothetical protein